MNGSPKGEQSVTLQSVLYVGRRFAGHRLEIFHVAQRIKKLEDDQDA